MQVAQNCISGRQLLKFVQRNEQLIIETSHRYNVPARDIKWQALLHLPRLVSESGLPDWEEFTSEVRRLGRMVKARVTNHEEWLKPPAQPIKDLNATIFTPASARKARIIHESFHYLSSFRGNSLHFGLRDSVGGRLIALLTISPFDLDHIVPCLPPEVKPAEVLVVSRIFSFEWAPPHTISHFLGQLYQWLRSNQPAIKMLLTYVNPNLGFSGASYKAADWVFFGREWGTRYAYINGHYVTDRQLISRFRTLDSKKIREVLGSQYQTSRLDLEPLSLFAYFLDKTLRLRYQSGFNHDVRRP